MTPAAQGRVALQHAVHHQGPDEALGGVVQAGHVLAADVLAAAQPVGGHGPARVHPLLGHLQVVAADMEHEWDARLGHPRPDGVEVGVPRRAAAARTVRDPCRLQPEQMMCSSSRRASSVTSSGSKPTPSMRLVARGELGHRPVVRPRRGIAVLDRPLGREGVAGREGGEHQLLAEPQHVERGRALAGVERPQGRVALRPRDQGVAQGDHLGHLVRRVAAAVPGLVHQVRQWPDLRDGDLRHPLTLVGVCVDLEEIRQLHDVAVGVVEGAALGIDHGVPPHGHR
jgi:hypothetical protein